MSSPWQGGPNFIMIRRGSNNGRKGGSHSGPSGYKAGKFHMDNHNSKVQSDADKAQNSAKVKAGLRHSIMKISAFIRKEDPERYENLVRNTRK